MTVTHRHGDESYHVHEDDDYDGHEQVEDEIRDYAAQAEYVGHAEAARAAAAAPNRQPNAVAEEQARAQQEIGGE